MQYLKLRGTLRKSVNKEMEPEEEIQKYKEPIAELRQRALDVLTDEHDDFFILRWLKAKRFDVKEAEAVMRQCLRIRFTLQIDQLPHTFVPNEDMLKHGFIGSLGFDNSGAAIRYVNVGVADFDGFVRSFSTSEIAFYSSYVLESDLLSSKKHKQICKNKKAQILAIFDLEEFTLQQLFHGHVIDTGLDLVRLFQDLYTPEVLKKILIINSPTYFSAAYNVFKPILRQDLIDKLHVCSSKESSKEALLNHIDIGTLPAFLGGTRVDGTGDPSCKELIKQGGKIPESSYKRCIFPLSTDSQSPFKEVSIAAGVHFDSVHEVNEPGTTFRVEMYTDNSVGLSILYRKAITLPDRNENCSDDSVRYEEEIVCPYMKFQTHLCPGHSFIHCERIGQYIIRFDNTFSWWTAKRVQYKVDVIPPT